MEGAREWPTTPDTLPPLQLLPPTLPSRALRPFLASGRGRLGALQPLKGSLIMSGQPRRRLPRTRYVTVSAEGGARGA